MMAGMDMFVGEDLLESKFQFGIGLRGRGELCRDNIGQFVVSNNLINITFTELKEKLQSSSTSIVLFNDLMDDLGTNTIAIGGIADEC